MEVRLHEDVKSFSLEASELLFRDLANNQVLLGQLSKPLELLTRPKASAEDLRKVLQLFSFHQDTLQGVLVLSPGPPGEPVLSLLAAGQMDELSVSQALEMMHFDLLQRVATTYGPAEVVDSVALALKKLRGVSWTPGLSVRAMEQLTCKPPAMVSGHVRRVLLQDAEPKEVGLCEDVLWADNSVLQSLTEYYRGFRQDTGQDEAQVRETMEAFVASCELYVWEVDKDVAAMACAGRPLADLGRALQMVYTLPEHRRKGYAGALVATLGKALAKLGKRVCLNADATGSHGALRLYESLGFVDQGLMVQLVFA